MSKEGVAYVDVELVCLKFDEFLREYNLYIHRIDGSELRKTSGETYSEITYSAILG